MPGKKIVFKLQGKPVDLQSLATPAIAKVLELLSGTDEGELFLTDEVAGKLKVSPDSFMRKYSPPLRAKGYGVRVGNRTYFGSQTTIKALNHELDG